MAPPSPAEDKEESPLSFSNKTWVQRPFDAEKAALLARKTSLPETLAGLLAARGIEEEDMEAFFDPKLAKHLPDPLILKDMDRAVARLVEAVKGGEKIFIFGDYDVDGATSTALIFRFLSKVGANVTAKIPEREEGYGPSPEIVRSLAEEGYTLLVTVDCGSNSFEAFAEAGARGVGIIVLDHHQPSEAKLDVDAFVNPKRLDEPQDGPCHHMAAVGVVFLLAIALSRALRENDWYADGRAEPDLREFLDIVALGTVCDVVRLLGLNRLLVKSGLHYVGKLHNPGLATLVSKVNIEAPVRSYHLGFVLGPRINASGRIGVSNLGFRLLSSDSEGEALAIAEELENLNARRRQIEQDVLADSLQRLEGADMNAKAAIVLASERWHQGVVGIVAGKLREKYGKPACVLTMMGDVSKGSGRSVPGVDLGAALMQAAAEGVILKGGGHAMAAGFTMETRKIAEFDAFLNAYVASSRSAYQAREVMFDGSLSLERASKEFVKSLDALEPYGEGNPEPLFLLPRVHVENPYLHGETFRCQLRSMSGASLPGVFFRAPSSPAAMALLKNRGELFDVLGHLKNHTYRGRESTQVFLSDARRAS